MATPPEQPPVAAPASEKPKSLLRVSDIISILVIGEAFALLLMLIRKSVDIQVPDIAIKALPYLMPLVALACLWFTAWLGKKRPTFFQLGKYAAIGFFNTGVDFGVFNAMVLLTNMEPRGLTAGLFSAISFTIAVANSYFWNKFWTFRDKGSAKAGEFMQFVIVSLIGLIINFLYISVMTKFIEPPYGMNAQQWANAVKVTGILISLAWNFTGYKYIVFRDRNPVQSAAR